jgi:hypothetical protein
MRDGRNFTNIEVEKELLKDVAMLSGVLAWNSVHKRRFPSPFRIWEIFQAVLLNKYIKSDLFYMCQPSFKANLL